MMRSAPLALVGAAVWLAACQPAGIPEAPSRADLSIDLVRLSKPGPPPSPEGVCWASDVTPMVIETVTEQVMLSDARTDAQGRVISPAVFRSEVRQKIVQEREEVWFRSPCPQEFTVDFIASLQRALKARGLYLLPLTGEMDTATRAALRRFQADRGLESDRLALSSARELGLVTTDLGKG
jgi:hypothetical protein